MKDRPKLYIKSNEYLNICRNLHHKKDERTKMTFEFWLIELKTMQGRQKMDGL